MLFPTGEFAIFFLVTFLASWASRRVPGLNKAFLAAASYVFYAWWDWRFAFLLAECSLVNYVLALWLQSFEQEKPRKLVVWGAVVFNLGVLAFFKYWGFFLSSFSDLLHAVGWQRDLKIMEVLLPVGVSFFTFQGISYIVDIYRREIKAVANPIDLLLFKSFFPQLVAGPIVRAKDFLPQLERPLDPNNIRATRAFLLVGLGLFKKIVIAHYLAVELVNPVFESPGTYSTWELLFAAYGYAVQIYCDFSAYTDIAIGVALLFGYEFPRNFDQPYRATSLQNFWRRWHISLSSFLRDYLYIPLGGSRGGELKTYRNLWLTMVLGGLWHGAAWNFVFWGVLHGTGLCVERYFKENVGSISESFLGKAVRIVLTFHFVCLTWIFFNADSLAVVGEYLGSFKNVHIAPHVLTPFTLGLLALGFVSQLVPGDTLDRIEQSLGKVPLVVQAAGLGFAVVAISALSPGALAPFIYFKF